MSQEDKLEINGVASEALKMLCCRSCKQMFGMHEIMILNWTEMLSMEMIIPVKKKTLRICPEHKKKRLVDLDDAWATVHC